MAGIFNPRISEASPGSAATIIPDGIGNAFAGGLDSIAGIIRDTTPAAETEMDKKNRALRPISEEFDKIAQLEDQGKVTRVQARAMSNALVSSSLQAFPAYHNDILSIGGTITGDDLENQVDATSARLDAINQAFTDDPELSASLPSLVVASTDANGAVDNETLQLRMEERFTQHQANLATNTRLKRDLENQKVTAELVAPGVMGQQLKREQDNLSGTVKGLLDGTFSLEDVGAEDFSGLLGEVEAGKQRAIQRAQAEAISLGLNGSPFYNTDGIASMFDGVAAFLKVLSEAPSRESKLKMDKSELAMVDALTTNGMPANPYMFEQMSIYQRTNNAVGFAKTSKDFAKILEGEYTPVAVAAADQATVILDDNGVVPDEITAISREMSTAERRALVRGGATSVSLYGQRGDPSNPELRTATIRDYGKVVAALNGTSEPAGPTTFNTIYTKDFVSAYNKILQDNSPETNSFRNAVANNLSEISGVALVRLQNEVRNRFSTDFAGFEVARRGSSMDVILGEPISEKAQFIRDSLKRDGLEFTVNNIQNSFLSKKPVFTGESAANNAVERSARAFAKELVGATVPGVGYLNQIQDFAKQLPGMEALVAQEAKGATVREELPEEVPPVAMNDDVEKILFPFIAEHEGFRQTAYQDTGGVWTIGYGHTGPDVVEGLTISEERAGQLYAQDSGKARSVVESATAGLNLNPQQVAALVSFTYNVGVTAFRRSTLLAKLKEGDTAGVVEEFGRWVHDNGKKIAGLVNRRKAEAELFQTASVKTDPATKETS